MAAIAKTMDTLQAKLEDLSMEQQRQMNAAAEATAVSAVVAEKADGSEGSGLPQAEVSISIAPPTAEVSFGGMGAFGSPVAGFAFGAGSGAGSGFQSTTQSSPDALGDQSVMQNRERERQDAITSMMMSPAPGNPTVGDAGSTPHPQARKGSSDFGQGGGGGGGGLLETPPRRPSEGNAFNESQDMSAIQMQGSVGSPTSHDREEYYALRDNENPSVTDSMSAHSLNSNEDGGDRIIDESEMQNRPQLTQRQRNADWAVAFTRLKFLNNFDKTLNKLLSNDDMYEAAELFVSSYGDEDGENMMASKLQLLRGFTKYQVDKEDNAELIQGLEDVLQVECEAVS
jgi:hypothetical protein